MPKRLLPLNLDKDRIRKRLEDISSSVERLKRIHSLSMDSFLQNEDIQDIARSRLLTAIQAALNICYHISAKTLKKVPEDYGHCFQILGRHKIIEINLANRLSDMAKFRNKLVHLYWEIDYAQVYNIIQHNLEDLDHFSNEIGIYL